MCACISMQDLGGGGQGLIPKVNFNITHSVIAFEARALYEHTGTEI